METDRQSPIANRQSISETLREPDFTLYFPGGDYGKALEGHYAARYWVMDRGLVFGGLGDGLIEILFRGWPAPRIIWDEADEEGWRCVMRFWFS